MCTSPNPKASPEETSQGTLGAPQQSSERWQQVRTMRLCAHYFCTLKENLPYKIAQHQEANKLFRQPVSNIHPEVHPETRLSKGFRNSSDSLTVRRYKRTTYPKDFQVAQKGQETQQDFIKEPHKLPDCWDRCLVTHTAQKCTWALCD